MFKMDKPLFGPSAVFRVFCFVLANGLWIALVAGSVWLRAEHQANRLAESSAQKVLSLMEGTIGHTQQQLQAIAPLTHQSCSQSERQLQSIGALSPYVRSLFLIDLPHRLLYCASSQRLTQQPGLPLAGLLGTLDPHQPHLFWSRRSPLSPEHAVVIYRPLDRQHAVAAVLEGRNFDDILLMMTAPYIDRFTIDIPPYALENNQGVVRLRAIVQQTDLRARAVSQHYNLRVSVHARPSLTWVYARNHLPLAGTVILAFLLGSYYLLWVRHGVAAYFRRAVQQGIALDQFEPYYQPIVTAAHQLRGVEVLIRWQVPLKGLISPLAFISQAEAQGLLTPIMISLLLRLERELHGHVLPAGSRVNINLSARQLGDAQMLQAVQALNLALKQQGYQLVVEVTEEGLILDAEQATQTMDVLRAGGILIAIDDFGIGHSSLSYLRQFPFDYLKIDKSFVDRLPDQRKDATIVEGLVTLARQLQLETVAEGVESASQASYLTAIGIDYLQGYLFSKPLPLAALIQYCNVPR